MSRFVLTGATAGVGSAVAARLAEHDLIVLGRRPEALAEAWPRATVIAADLSRPESLDDAVAEVVGLPLDGLVHVAGSSTRAPIAEADLAGWNVDLAVNLLAPLALTRALLPALRAAHGTVVVVNSVNALWGGGRGSASYTASKAALRAFADQLRVEEAGIRVTSVYPGAVATDMQRELRAYLGVPYEPSRYASPESVADAVVHALMAPPDVEIRDVTVVPSTR
jgi:NADP-dependent 3-hydroxy acid dehydrogenase YdfG